MQGDLLHAPTAGGPDELIARPDESPSAGGGVRGTRPVPRRPGLPAGGPKDGVTSGDPGALIRAIADSTAEGIWGVDLQGNTMFVNAAASRMTGWARDDVLGKPFHDTIRGRSATTERVVPRGEMQDSLLEGDVFRVSGERFIRRDGTTFPVELTTAPIRAGRRIVGAVVTFTDVTEKKLLETQLLTAQKLEAIGMLAAGIAHEINTPTQYVMDNAFFLKDAFRDVVELLDVGRQVVALARQAGAVDPLLDRAEVLVDQADVQYLIDEVPRAIEQSLEGLERVAAIIRATKEFSHPGTGEKVPMDLNHVIETTVTVCRNEWRYVADVTLALDPALPSVMCRPEEFSQVLLNIIINAVHAIDDGRTQPSDPKGAIVVRTAVQDQWVEVRIEDDGPGIPSALREKVFDPFFTTKEVGRGTGQGLAIARSIVDELGGVLRLESEPGHGATFVILLPLDADEAAKRRRSYAALPMIDEASL